MTAQKSQLLLSVLEKLKTDGVVFTKDVMKQYKVILNNLKQISPFPTSQNFDYTKLVCKESSIMDSITILTLNYSVS